MRKIGNSFFSSLLAVPIQNGGEFVVQNISFNAVAPAGQAFRWRRCAQRRKSRGRPAGAHRSTSARNNAASGTGL
jgi:hypothetical protein